MNQIYKILRIKCFPQVDKIWDYNIIFALPLTYHWHFCVAILYCLLCQNQWKLFLYFSSWMSHVRNSRHSQNNLYLRHICSTLIFKSISSFTFILQQSWLSTSNITCKSEKKGEMCAHNWMKDGRWQTGCMCRRWLTSWYRKTRLRIVLARSFNRYLTMCRW